MAATFHEVIVEIDRSHPLADMHHREILRRIAEVSPGFSLDELEVGPDAPVHRFRLYWRLPDVKGVAKILKDFATEQAAEVAAIQAEQDRIAAEAQARIAQDAALTARLAELEGELATLSVIDAEDMP